MEYLVLYVLITILTWSLGLFIDKHSKHTSLDSFTIVFCAVFWPFGLIGYAILGLMVLTDKAKEHNSSCN
jgi:hypothetical protein|tara:strand:+ start:446 stop:655 length:210 start_codon:yes stop_codon:yes gene_type:complete